MQNRSPKFDQTTDWPHLNFIIFCVLVRNSESKTRLKLKAGMELQIFCLFSLCLLSASHSLAFGRHAFLHNFFFQLPGVRLTPPPYLVTM